MTRSITIVIPTYNERANLGQSSPISSESFPKRMLSWSTTIRLMERVTFADELACEFTGVSVIHRPRRKGSDRPTSRGSNARSRWTPTSSQPWMLTVHTPQPTCSA